MVTSSSETSPSSPTVTVAIDARIHLVGQIGGARACSGGGGTLVVMVTASNWGMEVWVRISFCPAELHVRVVWTRTTVVMVFVDDARAACQVPLEFGDRLGGKDRDAMKLGWCVVMFDDGDSAMDDSRLNDSFLHDRLDGFND